MPFRQSALFLDLDGVLAPIAATPSAVKADAQVNDRLRRLAGALDGRLAVISGREIGDVDRILEGAVNCIAGVHGLERRRACGEVRVTPTAGALQGAASAIEALVRATPGVFAEWKRSAVALHYRAKPSAGAALTEFADRWADSLGLVVQPGSMVVELRERGPDKGDALAAFMTETPFCRARPIYVGDDLTDEAGFAAALQRGGAGIVVGGRRPTLADYRLDDHADLQAWLEASLVRGGFDLGSLPWAA